MMTTLQLHHVYPVVALVLLTFGIMVLMGKRRFSSIRKGEVPPAFYKTYQNKESVTIPMHVVTAERNYTNLFELPVLFYTLIALLLITDKIDNVTLYFSWAFVVSRFAHSIVHVTSNKLMLRMRTYGMGAFILLLLWLRFGYQLLTSETI